MNDHFASGLLIAQVNPGAQLCASDSTYECKYQIDNNIDLEIWQSGQIGTMIEHKPVNTGNTGSVSYSVGGGYAWGSGATANASFTWSKNWADLTYTDNSVNSLVGSYYVNGSLQSKVVTVEAAAVWYHPDTRAFVYPGSRVNAEFESWNTSPVFKDTLGITPQITF